MSIRMQSALFSRSPNDYDYDYEYDYEYEYEWVSQC